MHAKEHVLAEYCIKHAELAQAYVPTQTLGAVYKPCKALWRGTLFPELDKPYRRRDHEKTDGGVEYVSR
jgi:hypothetical protein